MGNKQIRLFLGKLVLFILLLIVLDVLFGAVCKELLTKQTDGRYYKIAYSLDKSKDDIIIIGSSRAETNYNPAIIGKELGMSCWNAGRGGQEIIFFLAMEEEILKRYTPKAIILNMDPTGLEGPLDYDRLSILRPFSKTHATVQELLSEKDRCEKYKLLSNIYVYNSAMFYFIRPFFVKNKDGKQTDRGWKPRIGEVPTSLISETPTEYTEALNQDKVDKLNQMIEIAQRKKIKLIIVFSPDYFATQAKTNTIAYTEKLSLQRNFKVINFKLDTSLVEKQKYFYDLHHMNNFGANAFSSELAKTIIRNNYIVNGN